VLGRQRRVSGWEGEVKWLSLGGVHRVWLGCCWLLVGCQVVCWWVVGAVFVLVVVSVVGVGKWWRVAGVLAAS